VPDVRSGGAFKPLRVAALTETSAGNSQAATLATSRLSTDTAVRMFKVILECLPVFRQVLVGGNQPPPN
jgi:hypothetical protein